MRAEEIKKRVNLSRVLRAIWLNEGISRVEIAKDIGVDKSTVSTIVANLLQQGVVLEVEEGKSGPQGGRKPIFLTINKNFGFFAGFDIQSEYYRAVVVNLNGDIVMQETGPVFLNRDNLAEKFTAIYQGLKNKLDKKRAHLIGIGVGTAGIINPVESIIYQSAQLNIFSKMDFFAEVSKHIDVPVYIENDANCLSWGELSYNKTERLQNFISVLEKYYAYDEDEEDQSRGHIGVGFGIVINGKVYHGLDFTAGEFRSLFWEPVDNSQFSRDYGKIEQFLVDKELFMVHINELARNLSLLVNTFNLSHIFFSGFLKKYEQDIIKCLRNAIQENWSFPHEANLTIKSCAHNEDAVAYGAAAMLLEKLFAIPEIPETTLKGREKMYDLLERLQNISRDS